MRSTARIEDVSFNTVVKLLKDASSACAAHHDRRVRGIKGKRNIQCDELWAFVYAKEKNAPFVKRTPPGGAGHAWTYLAFDRDGKMVVSYLTVKERNAATTLQFMEDLEGRLKKRPQITTDGLSFYEQAVSLAFEDDVHLAQVIKPQKRGGSGSSLYKRPKAFQTEKWPVIGKPKLRKASTSHVERQNLNIRMGDRRFTRQVNAFSKRLERHIAMTDLWFTYYNFCWIHGTIKVTPAMEMGLSDTLRDCEWIVGLIDDMTPSPKKPGPKVGTKYRKRKKQWEG